MKEDEVKVGYDGWPSRHDEWVPRTSDRLYLHESSHPEYVSPPAPQRYQRPLATDAEGNPVPVTPRAPRPKIYDPEKERLKRALRPPLPFNPEKERLKRLLRGQYVPPIEEEPQREEGRPAEVEPSHREPEVPVQPPPTEPISAIEWVEVAKSPDGAHRFRSTRTGEETERPSSGWVELAAATGERYYWHVERNVTQWERPT